MSASSPVPQAGALTEPRWAVVGATGDLLMPLKPLDDVDTIVDNLERIAKYRQALAIENPDPRSRLRGRFTVELQTLQSRDEDAGRRRRRDPDGGQIVLDEGDIVRVVVRSRHDAPVFVSLHDFGLSGAMQQIYPAPGRPGNAARARRAGVPGTAARVSRDVPVIATRPIATQQAEGIETVKLFVTEQPTDFSGLEQDGLRTRRGRRRWPRCCRACSTARRRATRRRCR